MFCSSFFVLFVVILCHLVCAPYSKVEESFNLQATHDLLRHGSDIDAYDHLEFSGVVPRTFVGATVLAAIVAPFSGPLVASSFTWMPLQYATRAALGALNALALAFFVHATMARFGRAVARWLLVLLAVQFHLMFYASRTLPNSFALPLVVCSCAALLLGRNQWALALLVLAVGIFRCELGLWLVPLLAQLLLTKKISLASAVVACGAASIAVFAVCIPLDSYFWKQPFLYAEGALFHFNVVLNKSSAWGRMPWHWYASSALPRALSASLLLAGAGLLLEWRRLLPLFVAPFVFVLCYSFLPHKETRFVIYVAPMLSLAAAIAVSRCTQAGRRRKRLFALIAVACVVATACTTVLFGVVSARNYAGGAAFANMHQTLAHRANESLYIHIDVAAAQTGVSRFGQRSERNYWRYSKDETKNLDKTIFTHLLSERKEHKGFKLIAATKGFERLNVKAMQIVEKEKIFLLEKV